MRLRRHGFHRQALPPPGRDRHALLRDGGLRHPGRRRGHGARARQHAAGAHPRCGAQELLRGKVRILTENDVYHAECDGKGRVCVLFRFLRGASARPAPRRHPPRPRSRGAHLQQLLPHRLPPQQHRMSRRGRMSQRQPIPFPLQQESRSSKRMMLSHPQPPLPKKPFMICTSF